ncbi:MAG: response regulator transcription factor [Flavobacteriales bacterium]|nr:response regulator transcription factor [Flavobacteriales bacterium]
MSKVQPNPNSARLLLAEDTPSLRQMLALNLKSEGHKVVEASNGVEALEALRSQRFGAAILDVMMPEMDGFSVCRTARLEGIETPILFLTARNEGVDRVEGLRLGANDYLGKPFMVEELLLRLDRLLEQRPSDAWTQLERSDIGKGKVDFVAFEATSCQGTVRKLSKREGMLLKLLIGREGQVVSREDILQLVWGYDVLPSTRTIDNFILAFRKTFEDDPKSPRHFHSVRGVGYKFTY